MSEFFLELLSEEIPSTLQKNARDVLLKLFKESFEKNDIKFKSGKSFSTPKRLIIYFEGIPKTIDQKSLNIKGPKVGTPPEALEGFIKSNNLNESDIFKESNEKGEFFFAKTKAKTLIIGDELSLLVPEILKKYSWKKSMRWADHSLNWGRPLKSILCLFDNEIIKFKFFHLESNNLTFIEEISDENGKKIKSFKEYFELMNSKKIIIDHELRKKEILRQINKIIFSRKFKKEINEKLLDEIVDLVEKPKVLVGKFDKSFLKIPKEILTTSMQKHQKYFPSFDLSGNLLNNFIFVSNCEDSKGFIKTGNERVISARLSDAKFFWNKNKSQNLVKQVKNLQNINYFSKLGTIFHKVQRIRKLGGMISDQLNLNKEKVEIAASICKTDLLSDLVGEYPELQGVMGSYFAKEQGFDDDIALAIKEHYLPIGADSKIPKKPLSISISIVDKLDTLVGFFGIDEKPTSSKDPFGLRRASLGLLRTIIENNLKIQINDLINYGQNLYEEQGFKLSNKLTQNELLHFFRERMKNYLKEKNIRPDIIEAAITSHSSDNFLSLFQKSKILAQNIEKEMGKNILTTYKRASNILDQEKKKTKIQLIGDPDVVLFKKDEEKVFFDQINKVRKYFSNTIKNEDHIKTLEMLSNTKKTTDSFFEHVIVNDNDKNIRKNRLELLQMFCKTYDNFVDFSKVEGA